MTRKTKAELEAENELLRETQGHTISHCTLYSSPTGDVCEAVLEIARALRVAGEALQGQTCISINGPHIQTTRHVEMEEDDD